MAKTPKRYADIPAFQVPLNPEQLAELGMLHAVWGQIDFFIVQIIARILDAPTSAVLALTETLTGGGLINLLRKQVGRISDEKHRQEVEDFCDRMGGMIEKRNHVTHGIWGWEVSLDRNGAIPGCLFHKNRSEPLHKADITDLLRRAMAESHTVRAIHAFYLAEGGKDLGLTVRFYFAADGLDDGPPAHIQAFPLIPGMDHRFQDQKSTISEPPPEPLHQ